MSVDQPLSSLECWVPTSHEVTPLSSGPLDGKTIAVKDLFAVADHVSSFGMRRWRETHDKSNSHAQSVLNLLQAGAKIAGLTKLDQLAYSLIGNVCEGTPPFNPTYRNRFTGGSSSGTASAVAGMLADIGVGTDTAGSVRVPAAACGLFGLRTTHGLVDREGVIPLAPSFDVVSLLTRESSTLLSSLLTICGRDLPRFQGLTEIRLAVDALSEVSDDTAVAVAATALALAASTGATLVEFKMGNLLGTEVADLFARLQAREIWSQHSIWVADNLDVFAPDVRARLERAEKLSRSSEKEQFDDRRARDEYQKRFQDSSIPGCITVLPILADLPPSRNASADEFLAFRLASFGMAAPSSLTGFPQLAIPVHHLSSGKFIGVGLIGNHNDDAVLVGAASSTMGASRTLAV